MTFDICSVTIDPCSKIVAGIELGIADTTLSFYQKLRDKKH